VPRLTRFDLPCGRQVHVTYSSRRRKSIEGKLIGQDLHLAAPAIMSDEDVRAAAEDLSRRLAARQEKRRQVRACNPDQLWRLAHSLNARFFGDSLEFASIEWVPNNRTYWGQCEPRERRIKIAAGAASLPGWLLRYLVHHELCHLIHTDHSEAFWELCDQLPRSQEARGFLKGVSFAQGNEVDE
jgi:hypothetical protein